jgi:drug/metabolite transporter (DMT)-like permease
MKQPFAVGLSAALFAVVMWGMQLPIAKDAFTVIDPFFLIASRYVIATGCLVLVLVWREGAQALRYDGRLWRASALGTIGMCASPMLVFFGMSMSRAEHAVVIVALQPAITALALWVTQGRRPVPMTVGCLALAFVGVVLVVTKGSPTVAASPRELFGDLLVLCGAACWVYYTMGTVRMMGWSTWRITVLTMVPGTLACVLVDVALIAAGTAHWPSMEALAGVAFEICFLTFGGVLTAMLAWNFGTRRIGALNAALLVNFMPVTTFGYRVAQGQQFLPIEIVGALLVVAALVANNLYLRALSLRAAAS